MERVEPVPAFATNVVVGEYPLEAFDVALTDARLELFVLFGSLDMEFCRVITILVAIFTKFNVVDILGNDCIIFDFVHLLNLLLDCIFYLLLLLCRA